MGQPNSGAESSTVSKASEQHGDRETADRRNKAQQLRSRVERFTNGVQYIDRAQFDQLVSAPSPPLIIDVREKEEIAVGTLPNGMTLREARELLHRYERNNHDRNNEAKCTQDVLCFCTVGFRSGIQAMRLSRQSSVGKVWNYSVMTHLWDGGELVRPDGIQWDNRVHIFSERYQAMIPNRFETVSFHVLTAISRALRQIPALVLAILPMPNHRRRCENARREETWRNQDTEYCQ